MTKLILFSLCMLLAGCSVFHKSNGVFGKASRAEDKAMARIEASETALQTTKDERLDLIGSFASGVEYSLTKSTNRTPYTVTALEFNERVEALANRPNLKESEAIKVLAELLITNSIEGQKVLTVRDKEIQDLQNNVVKLTADKEQAVRKYFKLADRQALTLDADAQKIAKMNAWGGLGAIAYGAQRLIVRFSILLGIGTVAFLVLRLFAASNPICNALFLAIEHCAAWLFKALIGLFPRALSLIGYKKE